MIQAAEAASIPPGLQTRGVAVLIFDKNGDVLTVTRAQGEPKRKELITGGIDENEDSLAAAVRELEEETGLCLPPDVFHLGGEFDQRVPERELDGTLKRTETGKLILHPGKLDLYVFTKSVVKEGVERRFRFPTEEVLSVQFVSVRQMLENPEEFTLAARRMVCVYLSKAKENDKIPIRAVLADTVTFRFGENTYEV